MGFAPTQGAPPRHQQDGDQGYDKSDTYNSDLIIECFSRDKSSEKSYFKQLISSIMINSLLPPK